MSEVQACLNQLENLMTKTKKLVVEYEEKVRKRKLPVEELQYQISFSELQAFDLICKRALQKNLPDNPELAEEWHVYGTKDADSPEDVVERLTMKQRTLLHALEILRTKDAEKTINGDILGKAKPFLATAWTTKIRYISSEEIVSYVGRIKLLIVTATEIETRTLIRYLTPIDGQDELLQGTIDDLTYRIGRFGSYNIVHFQCGMGTTGRDASTLSTYISIQYWRPAAVIMIGIAFGGVPNKQKLGDVLVSEMISSYESARVGDVTIPRGPTSLAGAVLLDRFRNMIDWEYPIPNSENSKKIMGEILSGDKLVDNLEFKAQLFNMFPNAIGGEMEGAGIYAATTRAKIQEWIVVKGICDWGDGEKSKESQPLAADAATSLCYQVFSNTHNFNQLLSETEDRSVTKTNVRVITPSKVENKIQDCKDVYMETGERLKPDRYQTDLCLSRGQSERDSRTDLIVGLQYVYSSREADINLTLPDSSYLEKRVKAGQSFDFRCQVSKYKLIIRNIDIYKDEIRLEIIEI